MQARVTGGRQGVSRNGSGPGMRWPLAAAVALCRAEAAVPAGTTLSGLCDHTATRSCVSHMSALAMSNQKLAIAVCGLHLRGQPLNTQLTALQSTFVRELRSAPEYRRAGLLSSTTHMAAAPQKPPPLRGCSEPQLQTARRKLAISCYTHSVYPRPLLLQAVCVHRCQRQDQARHGGAAARQQRRRGGAPGGLGDATGELWGLHAPGVSKQSRRFSALRHGRARSSAHCPLLLLPTPHSAPACRPCVCRCRRRWALAR